VSISLTVPARINILGNPADALEGDFATISAAVSLRAGATFESAEDLVIESIQRTSDDPPSIKLNYNRNAYPLPYDGQLDLSKAAFNRLYQASAEFRDKLTQSGVRIACWTDVPPQSGLGGSSLFVILALAGFREFYRLDRSVHNNYWLAELTQRVESKELGITCGFADRYTPLFGGIAYIDYRGKLHHRELGEEPYATYERLDKWVERVPLVLISTGLARYSGDVHGRMRTRYLMEHKSWVDSTQQMPPMVKFMSDVWETAWRGKAALLVGDWSTFGALMNENHRLVNEMMTYCGFQDGAGWANNLLIDVARNNGALGAKLTGAGGGGSVFALTYPGEENRVIQAWRNTIAANEALSGACVYIPEVSKQGLVIEQV